MPQISLTDFVDFAIKTGPARLNKVKEIKNRGEYHPSKDFWKAMRDAIVKMHQQKLPYEFLDKIAESQTDKRKKNRYPIVARNYKKFLGKKDVEWFAPPKSKWKINELEININPEVGLYIDGNPHIIKLFFKNEEITKPKSEVLFHIMHEEFKDEYEGAIVSILDLNKGNLLKPTKEPENLSILLKAEANTFIQIWNEL